MFKNIKKSKLQNKQQIAILEKQYFRLTPNTDLSKLRSEQQLKQAFELIKLKYEQTLINFDYAFDRLRSIRQEIHVHQLENIFSLEVYQYNAIICLQNNDLYNYSQCQNQIQYLFQQGLKPEREDLWIAFMIVHDTFTKQPFKILQYYYNYKNSDNLIYADIIRQLYAQRNYVKLLKVMKLANDKFQVLLKAFIPLIEQEFINQIKLSYLITEQDCESIIINKFIF